MTSLQSAAFEEGCCARKGHKVAIGHSQGLYHLFASEDNVMNQNKASSFQLHMIGKVMIGEVIMRVVR